jgi:hypothetical protein
VLLCRWRRRAEEPDRPRAPPGEKPLMVVIEKDVIKDGQDRG